MNYKHFLLIGICILHVMLFFPQKLTANGITVSSVSLTNRNATLDYVNVQFNITWDNSFRTSTGPANWDAAWVFIKYKVGDNGTWMHATLSTTGGHSIPEGATSTQPSDGKGIFIYRNADGSGTVTFNQLKLRWNYGTDGVADNAKIYVKVFAIEMVYVPTASFQLGDGNTGGGGGFRQANDVRGSGTVSTFTITSASPTLQGNNSGSSATNLTCGWNFDLGTTTNTATLASGFPTGYNEIYCMKYEVSQAQYRDFLNTLTYTQQASRTHASYPPNSSPGTYTMHNFGSFAQNIVVAVSGNNPGTPAFYGCNFNGNTTYNEAGDGEWIACSLSWNDLIAFLDWAALRPMTEMEYEKICRGNLNPVSGEFAWGNTTLNVVTSILNSGYSNESSNTSGANVHADNYVGNRAARVGMFATGSSTRAQSGSSYYGAMDMTGNMTELVISIGNTTGRSYTGGNGNGTLDSNGNADVSGWPSYTGSTLRGLGWGGFTASYYYQVSSRANSQFEGNNNIRNGNVGGRGVR